MWAVSYYKFLSLIHKWSHIVNKQFEASWIMWLSYKRKLLHICSFLIQDIKYMISITRVQWLILKSVRAVEVQINWNRTRLSSIIFIIRKGKMFSKCDTILVLESKIKESILPNPSPLIVTTWTIYNIYIV